MDEAFALAQEQKKRVDPMYHEKIDSLLDTYARKLAAKVGRALDVIIDEADEDGGATGRSSVFLEI